MQIKTDVNNSKLLISLSGRLDTITSPQLEEKIKESLIKSFVDVIYSVFP